jgi:hypothetical protein
MVPPDRYIGLRRVTIEQAGRKRNIPCQISWTAPGPENQIGLRFDGPTLKGVVWLQESDWQTSAILKMPIETKERRIWIEEVV